MKVVSENIKQPITIELTYEEARAIELVLGHFSLTTVKACLHEYKGEMVEKAYGVTEDLYNLIVDYYGDGDDEPLAA